MKSKNVVWSNLLMILAGVLLIVFHRRDILSVLIVAMGIAFIVPRVTNIVMLLRERHKEWKFKDRALMTQGVVVSLGGIGLGVLMMLNPEMLIGVVVYLFAVMLIVAGLYDVIMLVVGHDNVKPLWWLFLLPTLMVIAGIVILATDVKAIESMVVLVTGISLIAYAVNRFMEMWLLDAPKDKSASAESVN